MIKRIYWRSNALDMSIKKKNQNESNAKSALFFCYSDKHVNLFIDRGNISFFEFE